MLAAGTPGWPEVRTGRWDPPGITLDDDGVNAAVWAPGATEVDLCLFDDDGTEHRVRLQESTYDVFHGSVPGVEVGTRYGLRAHGPWDPERGARWNSAKLLLDPYARAIDGHLTLADPVFGHVRGGADTIRDPRDSAPYVPRCVVVGDDFDWGEDRAPRVPWGDTVIYEAHVKGLTARHPAVPEHQRGTYAGVAHDAVIEHLLTLGVTSVELLPVHHFVDEEHLSRTGLRNYWGYNSVGFFAPHGAYSSAGSAGGQVDEFKSMVRTLHDAGLEVILDVVYNHTGEGGTGGPTLLLRGLANQQYYRLSGGGRGYDDVTGTGNTVDASRPRVLQLITDSLRYWVQEMHVDGFRFDLASALARGPQGVEMAGVFLTAIGQDPLLRSAKLIAEPWDVGMGGYQVGGFPPPWTEWNDKFRDTVRDFWRGGDTGVSDLGTRLAGSADLYHRGDRRPYTSINFVTAHDGFTMRDLVTYNQKHNEANGEDNRDGTDNNRSWNCGVEGETSDIRIGRLRRRQVRNLLSTLVLASGVPMIVAGDEMGRTQNGNNNAYCQDNEISWVDWEPAEQWRELLTFSRALLDLRARHRVFRQRHFFQGAPAFPGGPKDIAWLAADGAEIAPDAWSSGQTRTLGMYLCGYRRGRTTAGQPVDDDSFLVVLHSGDTDTRFTLPVAPFGRSYQRILDTTDEVPRAAGRRDRAGSSVLIRARSLAIFCVAVPAAVPPDA